jgi:alpha-L-fucosidase
MKRLFFLVLSFIIISSSLFSQQNTSPEILADFMSKRFGMFIHWGPVTLRGTEIGWSRGHEVAVNDYDNLYKEFNPVLFDADKWVKTAKAAGMKYLTITAKHHDGFCLWPTKYSDYNIMNTPYKKDIVGELAKACKANGIKFCIYFTILDWRDKDYPLHNMGDTIPDPKADMQGFVTKIKNELTELITNYQPYMLWFDGNWEKPWTKEYGTEIYQHIKKLDSRVIVNNRLGKGTHKTLGAGSVGDYATPEQEIGKINMNDPWESCITICNQWAWKPNDKMKTLKESIQTLVSVAGGNGNLLYNVGPMPDGRIEERQITLLTNIGKWLTQNGESIYDTKGGPFEPNKEFAATRKGNKIYLHLFKQGTSSVQLPAIQNAKIIKTHFLNGATASFTQDEKNIQISFDAKNLSDENDTVLVIELDSNAEKIPVTENKK